MRWQDRGRGSLFSYVDIMSRIAVNHPLRQIREIVIKALSALDGSFEGLYASAGRSSIPLERRLRASLL